MSSSANFGTSSNGNSARSQYAQMTGATCVSAKARVRRITSRSSLEHRDSKSRPSALTAAGGRLELIGVAQWNGSSD